MKQIDVEIKLFIEGLALPVKSVSRTVVAGQPTVCHISIPPTRAGMKLIPGSVVHVFVRQYGEMRLFFEGIYSAREMSYGYGQNNIVLKARGYSSLMEQLQSRFTSFSSRLTGRSYQDQAFMGLFTDASGFSGEAVLEGVLSPYQFILQRLGSKGIGATTYDILGNYAAFSPYFKRLSKTIKLSSRLSYSENPVIQRVLLRKAVIDSLMRYYQSMSSRDTMLDFTEMFFPLSFFMWTELPSPKYNSAPINTTSVAGDPSLVRAEGNSLSQIIVKPRTFFAAPPKCNVMFQSGLNNFAFLTNYDQEPTRYVMTGHVRLLGDNPFNAQRYYAPAKVRDALSRIYGSGPVASYNKKPLKDILTDEELFRGVLPATAPSPFSESSLAVNGGTTVGEMDAVLQNYAGFDFQYLKYSGRATTFSSELNLNLATGFPAAIVVKGGMYISGELLQTIDSIDVDGSSQTTGVINFSRLVEPEDSGDGQFSVDADIYLNVFGDSPEEGSPALYDRSYRNENIGEYVYKPLLGVDSILLPGETLSEAFARIESLYQRAENKSAFSDSYSRRPIATEGEVMSSLLNAKKTVLLYRNSANSGEREEVPDRDYELKSWGGKVGQENFFAHTSENVDGFPFMYERRLAAEEYADSLRGSKNAIEG